MTHNNTTLIALQAQNKGKEWHERKLDVIKFSESMKRVRSDRKAARLDTCGNWLNFAECQCGKRLTGASFCRVRLCPICDWRRSLKYFGQIMRILHTAYERKPKMRFIFLTLTCKNVPGTDLNTQITDLFQGFNRLTRYDEFKQSVVGWIRALEVTYNHETDTYHPHFHVLIGVKPGYFMGQAYLSQARWTDLWQMALNTDYRPVVNVKAAKVSDGSGIAELSKYTVKQGDYIIKDKTTMDKVVAVLSDALHHRRLVGFGSLFKKIKAELNLPDVESKDVDLTDGVVPGCTCPICHGEVRRTIYQWNLGYNQYIMQ